MDVLWKITHLLAKNTRSCKVDGTVDGLDHDLIKQSLTLDPDCVREQPILFESWCWPQLHRPVDVADRDRELARIPTGSSKLIRT